MTKHYNTSISEDALRILNSKQGDFMSDEVAGPVAVIPIQRYANIVKSGTTTGASATTYTTPSDKDFYLCSAFISVAKDAAQDTATGSISLNVTIDGVTVAILRVSVITLTAQSECYAITFPTPLKLDRNTTVAWSRGASTAGSCSVGVGITGYTVETTR